MIPTANGTSLSGKVNAISRDFMRLFSLPELKRAYVATSTGQTLNKNSDE